MWYCWVLESYNCTGATVYGRNRVRGPKFITLIRYTTAQCMNDSTMNFKTKHTYVNLYTENGLIYRPRNYDPKSSGIQEHKAQELKIYLRITGTVWASDSWTSQGILKNFEKSWKITKNKLINLSFHTYSWSFIRNYFLKMKYILHYLIYPPSDELQVFSLGRCGSEDELARSANTRAWRNGNFWLQHGKHASTKANLETAFRW